MNRKCLTLLSDLIYGKSLDFLLLSLFCVKLFELLETFLKHRVSRKIIQHELHRSSM